MLTVDKNLQITDLPAEDHLFRSTFHNYSIPLIVTDGALRIQAVNQIVSTFTDYAPFELTENKSLLQLFDKRDAEIIRYFHRCGFLTSFTQWTTHYPLKLVQKSGQRKEVCLSVDRSADHRLLLISLFSPHQMTSRAPWPLFSHDKLRRTRGLMVVDDQGHIAYCDAKCAKLLQHETETLLGRPLSHLLANRDKLKPLLQAGEQEAPFVKANGESLEAYVLTVALSDEQLLKRAWLLILEDITDLKEATERITQNEKILLVGQLSANLAHEIKNPLHAMVINMEILRSQLLKSVPETYDNVKKYLNVLSSEISRLDGAIKGFLDFARPIHNHFKSTDINAVFETVMDLILPQANKQRVQIVAKLTADLPKVMADTSQLRQIFLNLLLNALEAMPDGGKLTVCSKLLKSGAICFSVTDTGVGIAKENLDRVFQLYFSTKQQGTGLGLSMVLRFANNHGARVRLRSSLNKGSHFSLTFPVRAKTS